MPSVAVIQNVAHNLQRSSGQTRLSFKSVAAVTRISDLYQQGCCKVRFPQKTDDSVEAVLLNTAGGLTDGDIITNELLWKAGSRATVTTQAAERVYRAASEDTAHVQTQIRIEADCVACWLPQETIVFDGSRLARTLDIDLSSGSRLIAHESTVFGRAAMGENVESGRVSDRWRIRIDGRLAFADSFLVDDRLTGSIDAYLKRRSAAHAARCMSTVVIVGADNDGLVEYVRDLDTSPPTRVGATSLGQIALVRILAADSQSMRAVFTRVFAEIGSTFGLELPRVWQC